MLSPKKSHPPVDILQWRERFIAMGDLLAEVERNSPRAVPTLQSLLKMDRASRYALRSRCVIRKKLRVPSQSAFETLMLDIASNSRAMKQCDDLIEAFPGTPQAEVASIIKLCASEINARQNQWNFENGLFRKNNSNKRVEQPTGDRYAKPSKSVTNLANYRNQLRQLKKSWHRNQMAYSCQTARVIRLQLENILSR